MPTTAVARLITGSHIASLLGFEPLFESSLYPSLQSKYLKMSIEDAAGNLIVAFS